MAPDDYAAVGALAHLARRRTEATAATAHVGQRTFVDDSGIRWTVWEVQPEWAERRSAERRTSQATRPSAEERRSGRDRRGAPDPSEVRVPLSAGLGSGWLVFESPGEK